MTSTSTNFLLEFINDVHARWLPVLSPKGSICLPESNIVDVKDYVDTCMDRSVGGAARWATVSKQIVAEEAESSIDTEVVRIILGDEFTGTPLFSSSTVNDANGEANKGYGAALHHYSASYIGDDAHVIFIPGNHEFDMGLVTLNSYLEDSMKLGTNVICANCDFANTGCEWDHEKAPYSSHYTVEKNGIKLGIWGMTTIEMSLVSICPPECRIKGHEEILDEFKMFYNDHDEIVIITHMGLDEDILFADFLGENLPSVDKIAGIYGSHTHSVICGDNGLNRDGSDGIIDATLGSDGKTACDTLGRYDESVKATLDKSAYTTVDVDGNPIDFPNYLTLQSGGIDIFHHAMHGLIHGSRLLQGVKDGTTSEVVFTREDTKFRTLDNTVVLDETVLGAQIKDVNAMIALEATNVARTDQILSSSCEGAAGCDGGFLLAMGAAGLASDEIIPKLTGFEDYEGGIVSIINGGGIRADIPSGQMSLLSVYSTYPFINNLSGEITTGESLLRNLLHGSIGFGEGQFFGARMVLAEGQTAEALQEKYQQEATAAGVTIDTYFCSEHYQNGMSGRNMAYEHSIENNYALHSPATATTYAASEIADDGLSHLEYTAKGCDPVDPEVGYNFEINTCALEHFKTVRASGEKTVDYFPPPFYNDCNCWKTIIPEEEYLVFSFDFVMNGGDGYCIEDTHSVRFDHQGNFPNGEAGCAALVMDFFQTYQDNVSGNKSYQMVTGVADASSSIGVYAMTSLAVTLLGFFF